MKNEAKTELDYIMPALKAAGWGVVEGSSIFPQFPITQGRLLGQGRKSKPLRADFVLQYKNRNIGVVESKDKSLPYTEGVAQAKDYAGRLHIRFTYATNGLKIYEMDMTQGNEGDVASFPTPDELWEKTFPKQTSIERQENSRWAERILAVPYKYDNGWMPRYYQSNAITKALDSIAEGKDRMLLTLATGSGKTAIAFQISWKLFHSKWNLKRDGKRSPRILFLADRNILADQAFNAFGAFGSSDADARVRIKPDEIKKKNSVPRNGNIFFTIFQTFVAGPNAKGYFGEYSEDFFDLIIVDECHRGGANDESSWREILEHFSPAVQIGLTATPKRDVNGDTYKYFGGEQQKPLYEYSLKEGINDGFLTPFQVKKINTNIDDYEYKPGYRV